MLLFIKFLGNKLKCELRKLGPEGNRPNNEGNTVSK
jgi:hypothetical protein